MNDKPITAILKDLNGGKPVVPRPLAARDLEDFDKDRAQGLKELREAQKVIGSEPDYIEEINAMRLISECLSLYDVPTRKRMLNWINSVHYPLNRAPV